MKETNIISKIWQPQKGRRIQALILCLAMMMLLIPASLFGAGENDIERLFGDNRYETMYQIALKISPGMVNNVVLTSGDGFADALAGVPFAHQKYAPILLVEKNPKETSKAIQYVKDHLRVNGKVYILGGTAVVSDECEKVLTKIGIKTDSIVRIAGGNRYETSVQIAKNMTHDGAEYYLVSGENFPDALSASVLAAITKFYSADETTYLKSKGKTVQTSRGGVPIILVPSKGQIPAATIQYLNSSYKQSGKQKFHIIGGTGAIPETAVNQLKEQVTQTTAENIVRLSGNDRYDTNKNLVLLQGVFDRSWVNSGQGLPISRIVLASGQNYPDALSGAVLAASVKAPLVLINNNLPAATSDTLLSFKQKNALTRPWLPP
jgi:putative cell wall-binding protein